MMNKKGQSAGGFFTAVFSLVLATILVVQVYIPIVQDQNTSSFTSAELALYSLLTLGAIAGLVVGTMRAFGIA